MPIATKTSGRSARAGLRSASGNSSLVDAGSASLSSCPSSAASISGVRRTTQIGLPRHSTVFMPPGGMSPMSTSTAAPSALARSLGASVETKGTAVATAATPPAAPVAISHWRRSGSLATAPTDGTGRVMAFMAGSCIAGAGRNAHHRCLELLKLRASPAHQGKAFSDNDL
jgi:hypothetical protein